MQAEQAFKTGDIYFKWFNYIQNRTSRTKEQSLDLKFTSSYKKIEIARGIPPFTHFYKNGHPFEINFYNYVYGNVR